jgi:hypothetical protein
MRNLQLFTNNLPDCFFQIAFPVIDEVPQGLVNEGLVISPALFVYFVTESNPFIY